MIHVGDFVSTGNSNQIYRISKMIGTKVSLRLINGRGAANIENVDVAECKLEYTDPRAKAVQHV